MEVAVNGEYEINLRLIYGHFNADICGTVDQLTLKLAKAMEREYECFAVPVPSEAVLCGLGSIGKSTLLINREHGNRLTIGAVLTDLVLEPDEVQPDLCIAGCRKCIESCPVHAIGDGCVEQKACRMNIYGKTARGFDTVNCNRCRTACPMRYGKK